MTNYTSSITTGENTLCDISQTYGVSVSSIIKVNTQKYKGKTTVGQYLSEQHKKGKILEKGLSVRIPQKNSGGLQTKEIPANLNKVSTSKFKLEKGYNVKKSSSSNKSSRESWSKFKNTVTILLDGSIAAGPLYLPIFVQEFSDNNGANFSAQSILGRSVDYQVYQSSSRDVSFTLQLHEELCSDYNYIHDLVSTIESACYPGYSSGIVRCPEIQFVIGKQFKIRGILTSCSASWKAPIIDGKLVNCDLSIGVKETTGPYSQGQISSKGGYR